MAARAQSLLELADRRAILIGAVANRVSLTEPAYTIPRAREFNMPDAEDARKWTALPPEANTFDFAAAARIVSFAESSLHESFAATPGMVQTQS